jgi:ribose/xylose/arabinose/galactoside ABC-type transport system permease subunit
MAGATVRAGRVVRSVPWAPVWLAIVVLWIASRWIVDPGFQSLDNIWSVATAASFIAVAAAARASWCSPAASTCRCRG